MDTDFSELFDAAVQSEGSIYLQVRDRLVKTPNLDTVLCQILISGGKWERIWVARIILGWREKTSLYNKATKLINGQLEGPKPITLEFGVSARANAVAALGDDVAPRLVEIVWKTKECDDDAEIGAVFGALRRLKIPETASPIRALLAPSTPQNYRHSSITTLGDLHDVRAISYIKKILQDSTENEWIRVAALHAYTKFNVKDVYRVLCFHIFNKNNPENLRINAAELLAWRDDLDTREFFHQLIHVSAEGELLQTLVDGLGKHGNEKSLTILNDLFVKTSDEDFQQLIEETIDTIKDRL